MSIVGQDEEFMDNMKYATPDQLSEKALTKAEKDLNSLQQQKQKQLLDQNNQFLQNLFQENSSQPIKIRNVQLTNGTQFRDSFVESQFQPLLTGEVLALQKYLSIVDNISKNLMKIGVVENILCNTHQVRPNIKTSLVGLPRGVASGAGAIHVVPIFNTIPIKRFFAKTGTNIGNGEGDGYIQFQLRNIFGGGENLVFDAITGTKTSSSYLINYNQPLFNNCDYVWENSLSFNTRNLDWIQSKVHTKSLVNKIHTQFNNCKLNHELILENSIRNLDNYGSKSFAIMQQCGQSLKSSIAYNINYDSRNSKHLPFKGSFAQLGIEYNGLSRLNKYPFVKTATQIQHAWSVPSINSHVLTSTKLGLLYPLTSKSSLLDRFYIGGPNDVRSFTLNGLGPRDQNSFVGGDLFLNGGVSLFTDVPRYKESNFKFHNFINWGKLVSLDYDQSIWNNFKQLSHSYCLSYGLGILYNHPMARFELNFVLPILANERDSIRKGIQYGIGVSFL
ncbi:SAM50 [Candida margitis]|uniref:SAM50 n=1 Tax=Candida margitis TaxID=1775924 RepID=UPI002227ABCE|nr:SAM50 [Candida margitis]KAI5969790.1 SAM50 [Candida margitis]